MISGVPWSVDEMSLMRNLIGQGATLDDLAERFQARTRAAVQKKSEKLRKGSGATAPQSELTTREFETDGDKATLTVSGLRAEVKDLDDLRRVCRIDPQLWTVDSYKQKAYQGFHKTGPKGFEEAVKVQLFSVTASLKARTVQNALKAELDALIEEARAGMPPPLYVARNQPRSAGSGVLASINVTDLHMGKYAWGKESGANYTVEIAEAMLGDAVEDIIRKLQPFAVEQIVLLVGSDALNADNVEDTTSGGTPQTTDGRQVRTFRRTWQLMRRVILRLLEVAPVHAVCIYGNHDRFTSSCLGEVLSVALEGVEGFTIDNEPPRRKYVEWGKCLIGYDHGDEAKLKDLAAIVPEECAEVWGRTLWRTVETGHLHQQRVTEFPGLIIRVNPALCAPEDWHAAHAYSGKIRNLHAQIWYKDHGNLDQVSSLPADPIRAKVRNLAA